MGRKDRIFLYLTKAVGSMQTLCHKLAGSLSRVAGLCQIILLSPKLEAKRATRKSGESCLSRKQETASQYHCVRQHLKASC